MKDFRRTFQSAMEEQFIDVVQGATGRTVQAYMGQVHVDPNVAVELFLLAPEGEDGANRAATDAATNGVSV